MESEINIYELLEFVKLQRIFLNDPDVLIKKICEVSKEIINNKNKNREFNVAIKSVSKNLNNIYKILTDSDKHDYDECIKQCIEIIHTAKKNGIDLKICPFDKPIEKAYLLNLDKHNFISLNTLVSDDLDYNMYNYRSYGGFIQLYSVLDEKNNLIISFRQSDSINDWIHNLKFSKHNITDIFREINKYLEVKKSIEIFNLDDYKDIQIHGGFGSGFFEKNDYNKIDNNLIEFLINLIDQYYHKEGTNKNIIMIGHSLGGAMSILASSIIKEYIKIKNYDVSLKIFTTGTPCPGDQNFSKFFERIFLNDSGCKLLKVIRYGDLVISQPPSYFGFCNIGKSIVINNNNIIISDKADNESIWYMIKYSIRSLFVGMNNYIRIFNIIDNHDSLSYFVDILKLWLSKI